MSANRGLRINAEGMGIGGTQRFRSEEVSVVLSGWRLGIGATL